MRSIKVAGLLAIAFAQLITGAAGAQDTRPAIERALNGPPSKTMTFARPKPAPRYGETWRNGIFTILEARLGRMGGGKHAPNSAAAYTCLDIDDRGHVVSAQTCRSSGDAQADKAAIVAATQGGGFPPPPADRTSSKLIWVHQF